MPAVMPSKQKFRKCFFKIHMHKLSSLWLFVFINNDDIGIRITILVEQIICLYFTDNSGHKLTKLINAIIKTNIYVEDRNHKLKLSYSFSTFIKLCGTILYPNKLFLQKYEHIWLCRNKTVIFC